jgi:DNA-binding CsgD family transcriptional regulator
MRDLSPVLDVLAAAETARDRATLRVRAVDALAALLPCDHVLWGELDMRSMAPVAAVTSDRAHVDLAAFGRHAATHPLVAHHLRTGEPGPLRLSDFAGARALRRLGVWADFYRPLDIRYALCVALPAIGSVGVGVAFHRARRDFDDEERLLLARVRPALAIAVRHASAAEMPVTLTTREAQVLRLVALGASNGEVALALHISPRTVEKHLEHVYRKLGVSGRYAAIASSRSSSVRP